MTDAHSPGRRRIVFAQLDPATRRTPGLSLTNRVIVAAILVATAFAVMETEPVLADDYDVVFELVELVLGLVFAAEYLARLWVAPEGDLRISALRARLRFMTSFAGLTDLVAIAGSLATPYATQALMLRLLRLLRILRVAKLGRLSSAYNELLRAVASRRDELTVAVGAACVLMLTSATLLFLAEGEVQTEKFGSIPRALWWSVATLTTIGYGDVYPVTPLGKVLASLTALTSIGLVAIPTGIIAAAFSDIMQRRRESSTTQDA